MIHRVSFQMHGSLWQWATHLMSSCETLPIRRSYVKWVLLIILLISLPDLWRLQLTEPHKLPSQQKLQHQFKCKIIYRHTNAHTQAYTFTHLYTSSHFLHCFILLHLAFVIELVRIHYLCKWETVRNLYSCQQWCCCCLIFLVCVCACVCACLLVNFCGGILRDIPGLTELL